MEALAKLIASIIAFARPFAALQQSTGQDHLSYS
jgi:hypothetical protein